MPNGPGPAAICRTGLSAITLNRRVPSSPRYTISRLTAYGMPAGVPGPSTIGAGPSTLRAAKRSRSGLALVGVAVNSDHSRMLPPRVGEPHDARPTRPRPRRCPCRCSSRSCTRSRWVAERGDRALRDRPELHLALGRGDARPERDLPARQRQGSHLAGLREGLAGRDRATPPPRPCPRARAQPRITAAKREGRTTRQCSCPT